MASSTLAPTKHQGGSFLLAASSPAEIFTPEDFTDEHRAIARTTDEFWAKEVAPNVDAIQHQEPGLAISILRKSAQLGLTAVIIPEKFGGMEMDLASMMIVAEGISKDGSYSAWHGAHTGIGTLPLLMFGTAAQKARYLPKLASAEMVAAYCLSEPQAGSDALAARTRADLSEDGTHYVLNGQKMWITNGGYADLYTVFAKVGGEKFTAFLVERAFKGVNPGAEEKKMGIKGSSTTAIYLDNVHVPVENVLGEVGRGHVIAFNILNLGRLKLGPAVMGAAKNILSISTKYAKQRKAFGSAIANFGAIQHKLAEMTIRIFATESMVWRVVGLIDSQLAHDAQAGGESDHVKAELKAVEEYAAECSMVKVFAAEMIDYVADEGVQIHGGYGFHKDYAVERYYRDARINRLFEGTSEINRFVITGMPLKRAAKGQAGLLEAAKAAVEKAGSSKAASNDDSLVKNAKQIALLTLGLAHQKHGADLEKQQEVVMNISDCLLETFAMESTLLRSRKMSASGKGAIAVDICSVFLRDAIARIESAARTIIGACCDDAAAERFSDTVRKLATYKTVNAVAFRRNIAESVISSERYPF